MAKKRVEKRHRRYVNNRELFAFLAIFLSVLGVIIAILAKREDDYVMYYARQSLVLFVSWIVAGLVAKIELVGWLVLVAVVSLWVIGCIYALSGEKREIPLIGEYAERINL